MVALGTGDGASIFAAEQGLEWTFIHSVPSQNPYHIRVVSNSWGTDGDYDPNGVIAQITDRLTFENGVAVIFAASNSGGKVENVRVGSKLMSTLTLLQQFQLLPLPTMVPQLPHSLREAV